MSDVFKIISVVFVTLGSIGLIIGFLIFNVPFMIVGSLMLVLSLLFFGFSGICKNIEETNKILERIEKNIQK
jgi:hypothetical protein